MTYIGSSTYHYNFTMNVTGTVSMNIIWRTPGIVHNQWYNNNNFVAPSFKTNITKDINEYWGTGTVC